jgi:hypothetical protein
VSTARHWWGRSRCAGAPAVAAAVVASAVLAAVPTGSATHPRPALRVSDTGCVAGDAGGQVHCQDVLNNSLNDVSVHILGR